jgi:hypothetical protein
VRSLAADGRIDGNGISSLGLRRLDPEVIELRLQRSWQAIERTASLRRARRRACSITWWRACPAAHVVPTFW